MPRLAGRILDEALKINSSGIRPEEQEWGNGFFAALSAGNAEHVLSLLAEDAVLISDGGGEVIAAARPLESREKIARFLLGILHNAQLEDGETPLIEIRELNGQTGVVFYQQGIITGVVFVNMKDGFMKEGWTWIRFPYCRVIVVDA